EAWIVDSGTTSHVARERRLFSEPPEEQCEACVRGKQTVAPYPKRSETVVEGIGDLVVMDTWGPAPTQGIKGERYFWAFTD
ncbi:hypothetical protein FKP32DRAFT_1551586, partial [Trametes sanguinea]